MFIASPWPTSYPKKNGLFCVFQVVTHLVVNHSAIDQIKCLAGYHLARGLKVVKFKIFISSSEWVNEREREKKKNW